MSPNPREVQRDVALKYPKKNRTKDYLPGIISINSVSVETCLIFIHFILGDHWRVVLQGDVEDYIHAVFVNVCTDAVTLNMP